MLTNQLETGSSEFQYGLGFGIRKRTDPFDAERTIDSYYWGGAAGTSFWIDPEYDLAVVFFTQLIGAPSEPVSVLSSTVYAALERRQR